MFVKGSKGPVIDGGCVRLWGGRALKGKSERQFKSWISLLVVRLYIMSCSTV